MYPRLDPETARALAARLRPTAPPAGEFPLERPPDLPTALIYATDDEFFEPDYERFIARELLGIEPIEIPGGHFPMAEDPERLADVLDRAGVLRVFLRRRLNRAAGGRGIPRQHQPQRAINQPLPPLVCRSRDRNEVMRKSRLVAATVAVVAALAIAAAGCGGGSSSSSSMPTSAPAASASGSGGSSSSSSTAGIPQNNGGDHDSDNNGGPSDGDGNI